MNILFLTYYFSHINVVSSNRIYSWAKHLSHHNSVTVVTRHWEQKNGLGWQQLLSNDQREVKIVQEEKLDIHYLPSKRHFLYNFSFLSKGSGIRSRLSHFLLNASGNLNSESDAYRSFLKYSTELCQQKKFDLIIVSSPPLNLIRLAYALKKKFGFEVLVDFRDLWHNDELKHKPSYSLNIRVLNFFKRSYIKRWLKNIDRVSTVSKPIAAYLETTVGKKCYVITNGYSRSLYQDKLHIKKYDQFTILLSGTYYPAQDLSIFTTGINELLHKQPQVSFRIILLGVQAISSVRDYLIDNLPPDCIEEMERTDQQSAAHIAMQSQVIVHAGWKGYKGIFTTKIFDFIASGAAVLVCPGDADVIDNLILETRTGAICNTRDEVSEKLFEWYNDWKNNGRINTDRHEDNIFQYSRESQAERLEKWLTKVK